jgi:uncharacterized membrane protein YtjA (UPF0391 family)
MPRGCCSVLRHARGHQQGESRFLRGKNAAHRVLNDTLKGGVAVLYYALVFLIVGLIAGVLGATGVAAIASQIAWILFIVGVILLVIHLATGRRGPVV